MKCSDLLVEILEKSYVKHIFGHPGEQILGFYDSLKKSEIKHILMRHEQSAAHAADGYARISGKFGVCVSTAGPGALNLTMGIATAFKDSVPLLVITGDNSTDKREDYDFFQSIDINEIFKNITIKSFSPKNPIEAISNLKESINILNSKPIGPVHINLAKNILEEEIEEIDINKLEGVGKVEDSSNYSILDDVITLFKSSKKPLVIAGSGIHYSNSTMELRQFLNKNRVPMVTTYPARGVISEKNLYNLGLVGIRGTKQANFAAKESDFILALGTKLTERTRDLISENLKLNKVVHVNLDENVLKGKININGDVKKVLNLLNKINTCSKPNSYVESRNKWFKSINENENDLIIPGLEAELLNEDEEPLSPQRAIYEIFSASEEFYVVGDAGSHSTWFTLLKNNLKPSHSIFSGGFAPMGYGLPASIGANIATDKTIILIVGDGGFQMTIEELAVISEYNLPIVICLLNNNQLGIIRQWQEEYHSGSFEVDLKNPNFKKISKAYNIKYKKVKNSKTLHNTIKKAIDKNKPYLIEIAVKIENIPLPK